MPGLKVTNLSSPDGEQDAQYLDITDSLRQFGIQAAAALLDESKVEARSIRDCFQERRMAHIRIGSGNCSVLVDCQSGDCRTELVTEVGIFGAAAVASPPSRVHRELRQVREPTKTLVGSGGLTTG